MTGGDLKRATLAVVTVLPLEQHAVKVALGPSVSQTASRSTRVYDVASVGSLNGDPHVVAIKRMSDMGNQHAQRAVHELHDDCPLLQSVIFSGVAGAAPNPSRAKEHVRLGDIVVGTEGIFPYKDGKEWDDRFEFRGRILRPEYGNRLIGAARRLQEQEAAAQQRPWDSTIERLAQSIPGSHRPTEPDDLIEPFRSRFQFVRSIRFLDRRYTHPFDEMRSALGTAPRVFYGVVASANVVQANSETRDLVRDQCGARCFEMEGYGLQFSAEALRLDALVVRGTSDYCNARKNNKCEEQWQKYAANISAAYVRALIEQLPSAPARPIREMAGLLHRASAEGLVHEVIQQARQVFPAPINLIADNREHAGALTTQSGLPPIADPDMAWARIAENLERLERMQLSFDHEAAVKLAERIEVELDLYERVLPRGKLRTAYFRLASVAVTRADLEAGGSKRPDYSHARRLVQRGLA